MSKNYLVTGATRGIGRAITNMLVSQGHNVVGIYVSSDADAKQLESEFGVKMYKVDLSNRQEVLSFIASIKDQEFDGLVNNAGLFIEEDITNLDPQSWDKVMHTNVTAPLLLTSGCTLKNGGAVVNITSTDAFFAGFASVSYAASKAALISLTKSLAVNLASKKVRVNAVAPGWVKTAMEATFVELNSEINAKNPARRNGEPEEVARLVGFLLSNDASYINAETIVIDGGYSVVDDILMKEQQNLKKR